MSEIDFKGIFPYLVTPVDPSGKLKEDVLRDLIEHLIAKGVSRINPTGKHRRRCLFSMGNKKEGRQGTLRTVGGRIGA